MPEATEATRVIGKLLGRFNEPAFADPDLQIRGPGHPDPEIGVWGGLKKNFLGPQFKIGPQFGPNVRGRASRAPPLDLPLTCKDIWMQPS